MRLRLKEILQWMYRNDWNCARVNDTFSDDFQVHLGLYQGSMLSPLLFIIVLKVLSRKMLHSNDLASMSLWRNWKESLEAWKEAQELNWSRVNIKKKETMISSKNAAKVTEEDKLPWAVWTKEVGSNWVLQVLDA